MVIQGCNGINEGLPPGGQLQVRVEEAPPELRAAPRQESIQRVGIKARSGVSEILQLLRLWVEKTPLQHELAELLCIACGKGSPAFG